MATDGKGWQRKNMAWARIDDGFGDHPKVLELIDTLNEMAGAAAIGLWTLGLSYAHSTMRTAKIPGYVPRSFAHRARVPAQVGEWLCDVGLWERAEGGWIIHDFNDYLPSSELKAKRAEAGRRGAEARWGKKAAQEGSEEETPGGDSNLPSDAIWQEGKKCPEPEPEPEPRKRTTSSSSSETASPPADALPEPVRDDVSRICRHLADRIEGNGSKRPPIRQAWRDAARLMLDRDGRTEADVHAAIDWCQDSEFWRGNVLSLPKLREKYDQLRLQATRERTSAPQRANGSNDQYLAAEMEWALQAEAEEAARQQQITFEEIPT